MEKIQNTIQIKQAHDRFLPIHPPIKLLFSPLLVGCFFFIFWSHFAKVISFRKSEALKEMSLRLSVLDEKLSPGRDQLYPHAPYS